MRRRQMIFAAKGVVFMVNEGAVGLDFLFYVSKARPMSSQSRMSLLESEESEAP